MSEVIVQKATPQDFEQVYPLFSGFREPRPDKETFRQLFIPRWDSPHEHVGYMLVDDGQVVGYLGTLFSTRDIHGRPEVFCNLVTWIVLDDYRTEGLPLLFEVLKLKNTTVTNFTGGRVAPILTRLGFKPLDRTAEILLPVPRPSALGCGCRLELDPERIRPVLDEADQRIFDDLRPFTFRQVLIRAGDAYSHLSWHLTRRKGLPLAEVYSLSHPDVFLRHAPHLMPQLCLRLGVAGLLVGEHFLDGQHIPLSLLIPQRQVRLFRSKTVAAGEMDLLYSELQVLDL
jgi:hypothetical protein